jgi:hypothetical protein
LLQNIALLLLVNHIEIFDGQPTRVCGNSPVLVERTTPYDEVKHFHDDLGEESEESFTMQHGTYECYSNIYRCGYDNPALRENRRHPFVHDEKACFDEPYGQDLHLFHYQDELGAMDTSLDLFTAKLGDIFPWLDEIAA